MVFSHDVTWFLAQLKPNCARIAERNLRRQGFATFLPMEDATGQRQGRFVAAPRPLFPGYIFVAFDADLGHWRAVNSTSGIVRLVGFGRGPATVPADLVAQLRMRCNAAGMLLPPKPPQPGDQVRMLKGPLASFVAEVECIAADQRVWLLMDIMGKQTRVEVGAAQLRAV